MAKKKEKFEIHPAVIRQLIENQAGTLAKAVLEGVMNGVDAMYVDGRLAVDEPRIDIDLTFDNLRIRDNGRGFQTQEEIEMVFKVFGLPHAEGDARFGRFRIGRGQLFGQGKTTYTSNQFRMFVDYRGDGEDIGYEFDDEGSHGDGVTVTVEFYDDRLPRHDEFHRTINEIVEAVKYLDGVEIYLNGELVSDGLDKETWTFEDDYAYYQLSKKTSYGQIKIYNQGVYVESASSYDWGCSGVVVSKEALPVNQARNQVQRNSPAWREIQKKCKEYGGQEARKKVVLDDAEVESILREMAAHPKPDWKDPDYGILNTAYNAAWEDAARLPIWCDVDGNHLSLNAINRHAGKAGKFSRTVDGRVAIVFAEVGETQASNVYNARRAIVLDEHLLKRFKYSAEDFITKVFGPFIRRAHEKFVPMSLKEACADLDGDFAALTGEQLKPREKWILQSLVQLSWSLAWFLGDRIGQKHWQVRPRKLIVGTGPANAWTDGKTYIALSRDFLGDFNQITPGVFEKIAQLVAWQYCYDSSNLDSRKATSEQRELYIELLRAATAGFGYECWRDYVNILNREGKKLPVDQLRRVRDIEAAGEVEYAYVFWKDDDEAAFKRLRDDLDQAAG